MPETASTQQSNHFKLYPESITVSVKAALGPTDGLGTVGVQGKGV